jgi:hypothetical protein
MGHQFELFVQDSRDACEKLQRFTSHVDRAVDMIIAINGYTLRKLNRVAADTESDGGTAGKLFHNMLAPFWGEEPSSEDIVRQQYLDHTSGVKEQIDILIEEGRVVSKLLENLEDTMSSIGGLAEEDGKNVGADRHKLMGSLWTLLGGYRAELYGVSKQLDVLNQVEGYRKAAYALVSSTLLALNQIRAEVEELRESVAAPKVRHEMVEVVPLHVQIEMVERSVERLKKSRGESRRKKNEYLSEVFERARHGWG